MTYTELIDRPGVMLVEFYATWCPHCQRMAPIVEQIRELLDGKAAVVQLDIDKNKEAPEEARVESLPTFIIYENGKELWRQAGEMDGEMLFNKIQSYL